MNPLRHQLPVLSPVSASAIAGALLGPSRGDPRVQLVEILRDGLDARQAVLCGSGTQALQLALQLAHRRAAGTVALPAFACFDLVSAAVGAQVPLTFFDLDPATLAPSLGSLEEALRRGARVVVVAPLYGVPVAWEPLEALCARYGAVLIEDAAQGQGGQWRGRPLGSLGEISVVSFGRGKGWTGGGGGALLLRGEWATAWRSGLQLAEGNRTADLRTALVLAAQWAIGRPGVYGLPAHIPMLRLGETVYHPPVSPKEMSRTAAAIAVRHRVLAEGAVAGRRIVAARWHDLLRDVSGVESIRVPEAGEPGYLRLPVMSDRPELAGAVQAGVARSYPVPLPRLPQAAALLAAEQPAFPGAELLARSLLTLPTHAQVTNEDLAAVAALLAS